jgi:hypothetical protein
MPSVAAISSNACLAEAIDRAEPPQQQIFPVLAHPGAIVENAFFDPFFHEQLMIRVGETDAPHRGCAEAIAGQANALEAATAMRGRVDKSPRVLSPDRESEDRAIPVAAIHGRRLRAALSAIHDDQVG